MLMDRLHDGDTRKKIKCLVFPIVITRSYLTIIPLALVGYDMIANEARSAQLAIIISYATSASGIVVLLKTIRIYC